MSIRPIVQFLNKIKMFSITNEKENCRILTNKEIYASVKKTYFLTIGSCRRNRRERDHWGDLGVDGCIILGWISRRWDVGIWTRMGWPRIETGGGRLCAVMNLRVP